MAEKELKRLITARGHVKGSLTRLHDFAAINLANAKLSIVRAKKARLVQHFSDYQQYVVAVSNIDPEDQEDVEDQENKYDSTLAQFNDRIEALEAEREQTSTPREHAVQAQIKLPNIDIAKFTGNYCEYKQFINMFKSVIHNNPSLDNVQRLYYLRNFLKGEPYDLIKNLPVSNESYSQAMKIIKDRYDNAALIMNDHISRLLDIDSVRSSASCLRDFVSTIKQHIAALKNINPNVDSWDPILVCVLSRKLDGYTAKAFQMDRDLKAEPKLQELLDFLERRALALESVDNNGHHQQPPSSQGRMKPAAVNVTHTAERSSPPCAFCKCDHKLYCCPKFKLIPANERTEFVNKKKLCKTCLNSHNGKCRYYFRCNTCKKAHNTLLHEEATSTSSPVTLLTNNNCSSQTLLPTAMVKLINSDGTALHIKALLDTGSQVSFVTSNAVERLGLTPEESNLNIIGITNVNSEVKYSIPLEVHSLTSPFKLMVNCNVVPQITCQLPQQKFKQFILPPNIQLADKNYNDPSDIDMLMGCDVFFQILLPGQTQLKAVGVPASDPAPCIVNTRFGYIVGGTVPTKHDHKSKKQVTLFCHTCDSDIKGNLEQFWKTEEVPQIFSEKAAEPELCQEIFKQTVILDNEQFQVDLPLKVPLEQVNEQLGDSFNLALSRFHNLEKKLHKNETLFQEYKKFIDEIVELGHGHYIDIGEYDFNVDPIYFLPHHAVLNEKSKSTKLRAVFDASMKGSKKISLNDILLNGPTVQNDLFGILMLFRFGEFMFSTDIKKMFRCIKLNPLHTSLQNILWRESPDTAVKCIKLDTVTYGLKSSSFLATRCLDELASIFKEELPLASSILKNCAYVDDVLYADNDLANILEAKAQLTDLLKKGGFQTHKWASNVPQILLDIPENEQHLDNIDLEKQNFCLKTLGIDFNVKDDVFIVTCPEAFGDRPITKREVLSYISKFYDPPGFVTPIIITAKSFIQKLWSAKIDWDSPLTDDLRQEWLQFTNNLDNMTPISLQRHIPTAQAAAVQLIGFADAGSLTAYGCCIFIRVLHKEGMVSMHLLTSKSRVNPLSKPLTVPRLELNACLLLSKLMVKVYQAISIKVRIHDVFLFSDSQIVLAWIKTQQIQLNAYVANRVKVISDLTTDWTWHYVPTHDNPADCITRGATPQDLAKKCLWWNGPAFLHNREYIFCHDYELPAALPEVKPTHPAESEHPPPETLSGPAALLVTRDANDLFERYSDIQKMTRIIAYIMRFYRNCKTKNPSERTQTKFLTTRELQGSLLLIVRHEQHIYYAKEINSLKNKVGLTEPLRPLHPFLDKEEIVRVGGRLQNSGLPYNRKHPIILPKLSRITDMIVHSEHLRLLHAGPKLLLSSLNERFWLIDGLRSVKKIVHRCVVCFRMKAEASSQLMGSMPVQRVTQAHPFERVGIDYAGPISIKQSRLRRPVISKGYICVFVCFTTKAVHLELATDLTTANFIACFKRFASRRGLPSDVFSDNASTFIGARNQLADLYKLFKSQDHQRQVHDYGLKNNIRFHFIPKYSPVFGGLWEASVRSTKFHLKRTITTHVLTYEEMCTILTQIEAVLNSRPLLPLTSNNEDFAYLTPGHFLTGRALVSLPERDLSDTAMSRLRLWNVTSKMVQTFWKSWHKGYLTTLQSRPKWKDECSNVKVGDLVLLREDNAPPLTWPMARITKVFPGTDNLVRAFEVMTPNKKKHVRSITKICLFPLND